MNNQNNDQNSNQNEIQNDDQKIKPLTSITASQAREMFAVMKQVTTKAQTNCGNIYILAALTGELLNCPVGETIHGCYGCQEYIEWQLEELIKDGYILSDSIDIYKCKYQNNQLLCTNTKMEACTSNNKPKRQDPFICCYKCGHYDECRHRGTMCDERELEGE